MSISHQKKAYVLFVEVIVFEMKQDLKKSKTAKQYLESPSSNQLDKKVFIYFAGA